MHDHFPMRSVLLVLVPAALALAVVWLLTGKELQDAVFAVLKLVVTR